MIKEKLKQTWNSCLGVECLRVECLREMQFIINSFIVNTFIIIFLLRNMDEVISGFSKWVMALAVPLYLIFYSYWVFKSVSLFYLETKLNKEIEQSEKASNGN